MPALPERSFLLMQRHLFITGPSGIGKTTLIRDVLGLGSDVIVTKNVSALG